MSVLAVEGADLYYEVHGDGPETIVFAHGAGGNHLSWWQQVPHFRSRYRCVVFDQRGFGQSLDHSGEFTSAFRRDMEALIESIGVDRVTLVGQSLGGFSCLPFAVARPERVSALLMADTFLGIWEPDLIAGMAAAIEKAGGSSSPAAQTSMLGPGYVASNPCGTFLYQQIRALTVLPARTGSMVGIEQGAVLPAQLAALTMPVVFLAGELDAVIPADLVERASRMVPGGKFFPIPGAGHSAYWETPDEFNAILDELLTRV